MIPFRVSNKGCPVPGSSDRCILISFTPRIGPIQGASVMDTLKWLLESSPYFFSNFSFDFTAFRYADFGIRFPKISVFCRNVLNTEETARSFFATSCFLSKNHTRYGLFAVLTHVKSGIEGIEILAVQFVLRHPQCFAESLEVNDLPFSQEFDRSTDIRVLDEP